VSVVFQKEGFGYYKILRARKMSSGASGNYVKIFQNPTEEIFEDNHEISLDSIKNTDQKIIDILGIDYDMFTRMISISSSNVDFLSLPATSSTSKLSQQNFLEKIFDLDILNEKALVLKESIKDNENMIKNHMLKIDKILQEQERLQNQINNAKSKSEEFEQNNKQTIYHYSEQLKKINGIDLDKERKYIEKSQNIKQEVLAIKQDYKTINQTIENITNEKNKLKQQIKTLKAKADDHDNNVKESIIKYEKQLEQLSQIDIEKERQYLELSNKLKDDIRTVKQSIKELNGKHEQYDKLKSKTEKELQSLLDSKCHYCNQHYNNPEDIKKSKSILDDCLLNITNVSGELDSLLKTHDIMMNDYEKYKSSITVDSMESLLSISNNIERITEKLNDYKQSDNVYAQQLKELESSVEDDNDSEELLENLMKKLSIMEKDMMDKKASYDELIDKISVNDMEDLINLKNKAENLKDKINDLKNAKNVHLDYISELENIKLDDCDYDTLDKLKNVLNHQQFLFRLLTKKDSFVRKNLLESNLRFLNSRITEYLHFLEFPYRIHFNTDLTSEISYLGREISYGLLSTGQRARVNCAITLSILDVNRKNGNHTNLLILDEFVDFGLDQTGLKLVVQLLKKKSIDENLNMFIISHQDVVKSAFDNVITVSMVDDFTKLKKSWESTTPS
jgi:DNA repair exonuclease SbcCD ATPase subunit